MSCSGYENKKRFWRTVGIEYTFLTRGDYKGYTNSPDYYDHRRRPDTYYAEVLNNRGFKSAHSDGDRVVEIPSPIHKNFKTMEQFYKKLTTETKKLHLKTHESKTKSNGTIIEEMTGGGHVHVGLPKFKSEEERRIFLLNLMTDIANRPYLNWIFNQWMDDENSNSPLNSGLYTDHLLHKNSYGVYNYSGSNKFYALEYRSNLKTLEFRFFDAPRSFSDVRKYVEFALAYVWYIYSHTRQRRKFKLHFEKLSDIKKLDKDWCWTSFNNLLRTLKLEPSKYKKFKINLNDRYEYGRLI